MSCLRIINIYIYKQNSEITTKVTQTKPNQNKTEWNKQCLVHHLGIHCSIKMVNNHSSYHEATCTPGIKPALALFLNAVLFNLKSRIKDFEFPVATQRSLICVNEVYLGILVNCKLASTLTLGGNSSLRAIYFKAFLVTSYSANWSLLKWSLRTRALMCACFGMSNFTGNLNGILTCEWIWS